MSKTEIEFPKLLKEKQEKLQLNNKEFAKYIGRTRAWLVYVYNNDLSKSHKLSDYNMLELNKLLDIPLEIMIKYNLAILEARAK